ncbi:LytR/AlgR family response regulator transcription factor [Heyndrickxia acidicola]|uniref:LytTR family DNA-binding domain-containing protein n=1 Tax=Heyndrickxia acidicola TaxID=209389 RepID=A0ABU6MM14_9BACI|nr:LytTR family DNA-binding domain-containing protein [Heyndrickxia acidicola]MED1205729.1 LytTR family DNA-binding domain-containing protein [Heyndrickxia acidicola]
MKSINVMIIDDNEDSIEILHYYLRGHEHFEVIGICRNGEELVDQVMRKKPDLLLVDINMPNKNGIEAVKECISFYPNLRFIFITGYEHYAVEAFDLSAVDYIVKPIEKKRLHQALGKAIDKIEYGNQLPKTKIQNLSVKDQKGVTYIPLHEIFFIEKKGKKSVIYSKNQNLETNENLANLLSRLDSSFYAAHRSYIINLKKISHIVPQHKTFVAYFHQFGYNASISKLKINDIRLKLESY